MYILDARSAASFSCILRQPSATVVVGFLVLMYFDHVNKVLERYSVRASGVDWIICKSTFQILYLLDQVECKCQLRLESL